MNDPINRSYEQLVDAGKVGIRFEPGWWLRRDLFSSGEGQPWPQCQRGGCHRPAKRRVEPDAEYPPGWPRQPWLMCDPCADAIEASR